MFKNYIKRNIFQNIFCVGIICFVVAICTLSKIFKLGYELAYFVHILEDLLNNKLLQNYSVYKSKL